MTSPGLILREIHRLKKHAKDLATRIEQAPRQLKIQQSLLAKQEENLKQAQDAVKHLKVQIHEKEVSIKSVQGVIKKHEKQLDESGNKKEYDALKTEIANEKKSISKLEDEILEHMAEVEERSAKLPEMDKMLQKGKADLVKFQSEQAEKLIVFQAERTKAEKELAAVEAKLPEDIRIKYVREAKSRGEDALSAVLNRTCSACYTEVTPQMLNNLNSSILVICKACGRFLYVPE